MALGIFPSFDLYVDTTGYNPPALDFRDTNIPNFKVSWHDAPTTIGAMAKFQPTAEVYIRVDSGIAASSFLTDFYYRIHVNPQIADVGNLISTKTMPIEVWNSWFQDATLESLTGFNVEGMSLTGQPTPPIVFGRLASKIFTLEVTPNGPPSIQGRYEMPFDIETAWVPTLNIVGVRILAWWPRANWADKMVERLEWYTNVIESRNGKEQRIKVRGKPRRIIEYSAITKDGQERRLLENLLWAWQSRVYGLPIWFEQEFSQVEIPLGSINIPCDTATRDYFVGSLVGLVHDEDTELNNITEVHPDHVVISSPTTSYWPIGTKVLPVRTARISDKTSLTRVTDTILTMGLQFILEEGEQRSPLTEVDEYRSNPVLGIPPNWRETITAEYTRKLNTIDFVAGKRLVDDLSGVPTVFSMYHWQASGRDAVHSLRQFLLARHGKLVPIWLPTFMFDFQLLEVVGAASTQLTVANQRYSLTVNCQVGRRDLRIILHDGTIFYRRILSAGEDVDGNEFLNIDSALGLEIDPSDVYQICFMSLCRLDADSLELVWETDGICEVQSVFRSLRDDVL